MLRRLLEGCGLLLLVAVLFNRVEVGFIVPALGVGAMMADAPAAHAGDGGDAAMGGIEGAMDIGGGFGGDM